MLGSGRYRLHLTLEVPQQGNMNFGIHSLTNKQTDELQRGDVN